MSNLIYDGLVAVAVTLAIFYVGIPLLFTLFPQLMKHIFFLNFVKFPNTDYSNLSSHGVRSIGRNFYLKAGAVGGGSGDTKDKEERIGVWHILPSSLSGKYRREGIVPSEKELEESLDVEHHGVIVYFHGNSFDRTAAHRVELYNVLSEMDFHVLSIDYRGYGDSSGSPSEDGLALDAQAVYEYARGHAPSKEVFVWGHSLGTAIASRAVAEFSGANTAPQALILEAPFNTVPDVIKYHPFSFPWRYLPFFEQIIVSPLVRTGLIMNSEKQITKITCPLLILHAIDDHIIPIALGEKLAEEARQAGRDVTFIRFEAHRLFKHKFIHKAEELPQLVMDFLSRATLKSRSRNRSKREEE